MALQRFDLAVLGAGSAGIAMAIRAARHGARVALIEPGAPGGTCVNVGCVPKKAMWLAAELAEAQRIARTVGFDVAPGALDWGAFVERREGYIANIHASYRRRFEELGIEVVSGRGELLGSARVRANGREIDAAHILVATGGRPRRETIPGGELGIDSNGFFALRACPRNVAIVGSGYIGVELAGVLRALGADVTVFARSDRLLHGLDHEVTDALADAMRARGIRLSFSRGVVAVAREEDGYRLDLEDGSREGGFDELIWATGRLPNTQDIGLEAAGVRTDENGFIVTDEWQDTSVAGIHAVGDVTGRLALTPVAVAASRRLADRLFGGQADAKLDYDDVPTVVFSHPPLASVGLAEEAARERHGEGVTVHRARFRPMLGALAGDEERTLMKVVCAGPEERIVGIHVLGTAADEMLQGFAVALKMGARRADFAATVAIHPTSAEELVLI